MSRGRVWCFTLHADEEAGEEFAWPLATQDEHPLSEWAKVDHFKYMLYQVEKAPDTGKVHLQGFICFDKTTRLAALKKLSARAHWESARGSFKDNVEYCSKSKSKVCGPFQMGEPPAQGKRTDLVLIGELVKAGKTNVEILEATECVAARFERPINFIRYSYMAPQSDRQLQGVRVIVLYGDTDAGKTFAAVNYIAGAVDYHIVTCPSHKDGKLWFDGYEGQKTLILDDFSGDFCNFRYLLRLLDVYKLAVEIKGGHVWACWTTVVVTTNIHPRSWYSGVNLAPLCRRIHEIRYMESHLDESEPPKPVYPGAYKFMGWDESVHPEVAYFQVPVPAAAAAIPASPSLDDLAAAAAAASPAGGAQVQQDQDAATPDFTPSQHSPQLGVYLIDE